VAVLERVVSEHGITAVHANHAVLVSVVAQRVCTARAIPYTIMPHGSAIEYAVKKDERLFRLAAGAFAGAGRIFVIGPEIRERVNAVFSSVEGIDEKLVNLNLGVDTSLFEPVSPEHRRGKVLQLVAALEGVERGKRPEQTRTLRHRLGDEISEQALQKALVQSSDYTAKHADADCEAKLERVDWERDRILLFVGRLIASKGIHGVLAALPSILQQQPDLRLVIVGHGPLREPLEAMLWALDTGHRTLFSNIVRWGRSLEGSTRPEPLVHVQRYLEHLDAQGKLDDYFESAREQRLSERVIFTGYLKHRELRYLFPCCDVAIFPSIVAEAGPLVFLEALASGVFPMGIYFAGMAASIDSVSEIVPAEVVELMKLREDPAHMVADIVEDSLGALSLGRRHAADLRRVAVERYDWAAVANKLLTTLQGLTTSS
jgi:glycosyltransferase involved in cell wall biosynthesis